MDELHEILRSLRRQLSWLISGILLVTVFIFLYSFNPGMLDFLKSQPKTWELKIPEEEFAAGVMDPEVKYGYLILSETSRWIGPGAEDPAMHFSGNNLSCTNCHLKGGTQAGSGSWVGVTDRYPQFRGRENTTGTIEDRINGCMERSMNGRKLPEDSREMQAMVTYMEWLGEGLPEERLKEFSGYPKINIPNVAVDLEKGKAVYSQHCVICHGENGQGAAKPDGPGYVYPPLWGNDTYNNGAGMHRVITAAEFIKSNMPYLEATWENPKLTDEEAYHVAGYINSFARPEKSNLEADFPDKKLKPVSTPYGPWADDFSPDQHKFGPFPPIIEYYKKQYQITKSK
ncbi:c-type cytochrome [Robertkochia flava]|uniref:c-type cytochrome n=1 Tax=Robertkochia flava TaxID=3447986 RepID=UPI001CCBB07C|nr:c-type cytochrome [Robertkochia marina]